ncbi:hypothetical protein M422DRAFT_251606 [Sphaerobolus stellatus SS14]|uniref:Uncharacterized protein n=1 Tax=Sphaerobolus stellatus (strain SS14) TaxID=990650 RepID=A0A0C9VRG2_SPHS4|nr:hypothetical protein M422DRAFT_251606 [Sphaerobolus stellatus SS14]
MPVEDPKHLVKVQVTNGALMIAILINTFITLTMVIQYFKRQAKRDTIALKITIFLLILLATLETIFTSHRLYDTFIINMGNLDPNGPVLFSVPGANACIYLTAFVAQLFFASRIWSVSNILGSRLRFMIVPVILLALLQIIYAINRGIVTSICALLSVFLCEFVSRTYYFMIPQLANTHLYVISAVSIVTSREGLREKINQSFHLSDLYTTSSDVTNGRDTGRSDFTSDKNLPPVSGGSLNG